LWQLVVEQGEVSLLQALNRLAGFIGDRYVDGDTAIVRARICGGDGVLRKSRQGGESYEGCDCEKGKRGGSVRMLHDASYGRSRSLRVSIHLRKLDATHSIILHDEGRVKMRKLEL
jgi:hypothetical protein